MINDHQVPIMDKEAEFSQMTRFSLDVFNIIYTYAS